METFLAGEEAGDVGDEAPVSSGPAMVVFGENNVGFSIAAGGEIGVTLSLIHI